MLALPFGDVGDIDHIHRFDLRGKFLLPPCVRWAGLIIVLAWRPFPLLFGISLIGTFEDPTICVGVVCRLVGGTVNLARPIKYLF